MQTKKVRIAGNWYTLMQCGRYLVAVTKRDSDQEAETQFKNADRIVRKESRGEVYEKSDEELLHRIAHELLGEPMPEEPNVPDDDWGSPIGQFPSVEDIEEALWSDDITPFQCREESSGSTQEFEDNSCGFVSWNEPGYCEKELDIPVGDWPKYNWGIDDFGGSDF